MERKNTVDVFTPTKPARVTFVERIDANDQLVDALRTPGKQIVVFGTSGSGKTTLLVNKLCQIYESHVTVHCTRDTTFEQVMHSAFDKLDAFYLTEKSKATTSEATSKVASKYLLLKAAVEASVANEEGETASRAVGLQLTPERLAEFLGEAHSCLVLDDFHKLLPEEKTRVAQSMKVFMDMAADYPDVRLVLIGAVNSAREVIEYDSEMRNRVAEVFVSLMTDDETRQILEKGEEVLNIEIPSTMRSEIVHYAGGVAAVAHQLGLNLCFAANVMETQEESFLFQEEHLKRALDAYIRDSSDSFKARFDQALRRTRTRKYDNCRLILGALARHGREGATHADILKTIRKSKGNYPSGNLTRYLRELQGPDRGEIVRCDPEANRYFFSHPLYWTYAVLTLLPKGSAKEQLVISRDFLTQFILRRFLTTVDVGWKMGDVSRVEKETARLLTKLAQDR